MQGSHGHINRAAGRGRWQCLARRAEGVPDPLSVEVAWRHAEALEAVNLPAGAVLDLGSGCGRIPVPELACRAVRLDWVAWPGAGTTHLVADACRLPFATDTFAVVWSNLCLPWIADLAAALLELRRVLHPGGLLTVTSFGPDTLAWIRERCPGPTPRTLGFLDMHDLTDLLLHSGFAEPVAVRENITFSYPDPTSMLAELRTFGALASQGMATHLGHKAAIAQLGAGTAPVELGFEVIHLHAWALPRRRPKVPEMWQDLSFHPSVQGSARE